MIARSLLLLILLMVGGAFFVVLGRQWQRLVQMAPQHRWDAPVSRLGRALGRAFLQVGLFRFPGTGLLHAVVFFGFWVLLPNTLLLILVVFQGPAVARWLDHHLIGQVYSLFREVAEPAVFMGALFMLLNRLIGRPKRMIHSREAVAILVVIDAMMVADSLFWASLMWGQGPHGWWQPFSVGIYHVAGTRVSAPTAEMFGLAGLWIHLLSVFGFLLALPFGKHFHVMTVLPNLFFDQRTPMGRLSDDEAIKKMLADEEPVQRVGAGSVDEFTWKDGLEWLTCTQCGRCHEVCPAVSSGRELSPRDLMIDLRGAMENGLPKKDGASVKALVPGVISAQVVWDCTTCGACEQACPVGNRFVDKIVRMRRFLVEEAGMPPKGVRQALVGMERSGNPWGMAGGRQKVEESGAADSSTLYFAGCFARLDSVAGQGRDDTLALFEKAGLGVVTMGADEPCCGETARRMGGESTFAMAAMELIERFRQRGISRVITGCPHCYNTFKNEYTVLGGDFFEVRHHTEVLADLVNTGRLAVSTPFDQTVTYQDPCYLTRYNSLSKAPRSLLDSAVVAPIMDGVDGLGPRCCGAGGGHFFMDHRVEQRINRTRLAELGGTGAKMVATGCPYCLAQLRDGAVGNGTDPDLIMDVASLLRSAVNNG